MNTLRGSFYVLFLSYRKQAYIFWTILFAIWAASFGLVAFFSQSVQVYFILTVSGPVYVFYGIMASKLLDRTFRYFLNLGVSRLQYLLHIGLFFIAWSIIGAFMIGCLQQVTFYLVEQMGIEGLRLLHPVLLYDLEQPFLLTFVLDVCLLLSSLVFGLFTNMLFYRYGVAGGYSFMGFLIFLPIVIIILDWHPSILEMVLDMTFVVMIVSICLFSIFIYSAIWKVLHRAPAVKV
ncbi:MAG: hypothetical protein ACI4XL_10935 [Bacillus sp. (in: firmicutes)]